jgi:hypothetical protein
VWSSIKGDTVSKSDRSVGVEHHSKSGAHSSGREISSELSSDGAVVAVRLDDSAPDGSEFGVVSNTLGLVNISDSLAIVEASVLLIIHTLDLQESKLLVLSGLASLESGEDGLCVKSKTKFTKRTFLPNGLSLGLALCLLFCFFSHLYIIMIIEYI